MTRFLYITLYVVSAIILALALAHGADELWNKSAVVVVVAWYIFISLHQGKYSYKVYKDE